MADTKKYGWNVQIDGVQYLVEYMKGSIFINGGEAFKLRSLERTGTLDKQMKIIQHIANNLRNFLFIFIPPYQYYCYYHYSEFPSYYLIVRLQQNLSVIYQINHLALHPLE